MNREHARKIVEAAMQEVDCGLSETTALIASRVRVRMPAVLRRMARVVGLPEDDEVIAGWIAAYEQEPDTSNLLYRCTCTQSPACPVHGAVGTLG